MIILVCYVCGADMLGLQLFAVQDVLHLMVGTSLCTRRGLCESRRSSLRQSGAEGYRVLLLLRTI